MAIALLTPEQVGERLGVAVRTLYSWRQTGYGPAGIRVGKYLRYTPEAVEAFLASLEPTSNVTPLRRARSA